MNLNQTDQSVPKEDKPSLHKIEDLACWRTELERRTYKSKILNKTFRFTRHRIIEYVNMWTGEIVSLEEAKRLGAYEFDYGHAIKERYEILDGLRQEVKDFAVFVLQFRNKRRGLSPNLKQVVEYYSKYTGKRIDNIKSRLLPHIMNKVVYSETLMMPPFQISGKKVQAHEHLHEDFVSESKFFMMMLKKSFRIEE